MPLSKRKAPPKRIATKRQVATWQRQERAQRIAFTLGIVVIAAVLALVGYGYYDSQLKPLYQPVVRVNDTVRNVKYTADMLRIQAPGYKPEQLESLVDQVAAKIENAELIAQAAHKLNISVSPQEVERGVIARFSAGSDGKKLSDDEALKNYQQILTKYKVSDKDFKKVTEINLLQDKLQEYVAKQVPTSADQVNVLAILAPDLDDAVKARARLEQGESFTKVASEVSLLPMVKQEPGDLGWLPKEMITTGFDQIAFSQDPGSLTEPIWDEEVIKQGGYWIIMVWAKQDDMAIARGILLGSRKEAEEIRAKLQAGGDFAALVQQHSQDTLSKERGGEMGTVSKIANNTEFEKAILALEPNTWSAPIFRSQTSTKGGYWIIKVKEKAQNKELDKDTRDTLSNKAFSEWLDKERKASTIERYLDDSKKSLIIKLVSGKS